MLLTWGVCCSLKVNKLIIFLTLQKRQFCSSKSLSKWWKQKLGDKMSFAEINSKVYGVTNILRLCLMCSYYFFKTIFEKLFSWKIISWKIHCSNATHIHVFYILKSISFPFMCLPSSTWAPVRENKDPF